MLSQVGIHTLKYGTRNVILQNILVITVNYKNSNKILHLSSKSLALLFLYIINFRISILFFNSLQNKVKSILLLSFLHLKIKHFASKIIQLITSSVLSSVMLIIPNIISNLLRLSLTSKMSFSRLYIDCQRSKTALHSQKQCMMSSTRFSLQNVHILFSLIPTLCRYFPHVKILCSILN